MPIYEYACGQCGKLNEVIQKVNDAPPSQCDGCGKAGPLQRVVSKTSFVLKGGGWYSDLYSSTKKKDGGGKAEGSGSSAPASSAGTSPAASAAPASSAPAASSGAGKKDP